MARAVLIANPVAARAKAGVVTAMREALMREGWTIDVRFTVEPDDAASFAREAVESGADRVVIYGGDGTTMRALRGLVGHPVPVGLLPAGTGNLLAGNLRLPRRLRDAARVVARGVPRSIDLGRLARDDGPRYFTVACGTGFDAALMAGTSERAKRRWGFAAYVAHAWRILSDIRSVTHRLTVDGKSFEVEAATVLVANCGEIKPPFLRLGRGIALDDGQLDVVVLRADNFRECVGVLWRLMTGGSNGTHLIRHVRGCTIRVEPVGEQAVQLDGEPGGHTPFEVQVVPGAIEVLVPISR